MPWRERELQLWGLGGADRRPCCLQWGLAGLPYNAGGDGRCSPWELPTRRWLLMWSLLGTSGATAGRGQTWGPEPPGGHFPPRLWLRVPCAAAWWLWPWPSPRAITWLPGPVSWPKWKPRGLAPGGASGPIPKPNVDHEAAHAPSGNLRPWVKAILLGPFCFLVFNKVYFLLSESNRSPSPARLVYVLSGAQFFLPDAEKSRPELENVAEGSSVPVGWGGTRGTGPLVA